MKKIIAAVVFSLVSVNVVAAQKLCEPSGDPAFMKYVAWDESANVAHFVGRNGEEAQGDVAGYRDDVDGKQVNMTFSFNKGSLKGKNLEVTAFAGKDGSQRVAHAIHDASAGEAVASFGDTIAVTCQEI